jgi:(R,R)-butanediol dehydrogenase/meso-butanediol dehydrogenase/diacetyl reductase
MHTPSPLFGAGVEGWSRRESVRLPFTPLEQFDIAAAMGRGIGLGTNDGGYAETVTVPAEMLWRPPDEFEHGALIEPLAVALHEIDVSGAQPRQSVCFLGDGPIGVMAVVGLRARGFDDVMVVEPHELRRELATRLGASVARSGSMDSMRR